MELQRVRHDWVTELNWIRNESWILFNAFSAQTEIIEVFSLLNFSSRTLHKFIRIPSQVKVKVKSLSCVWLFAIPWTVAYHAPPSMGFSRQEYWSGLPFISFSRGSSQPRYQTWVSCVVGRHFTIWATREVQKPSPKPYFMLKLYLIHIFSN